MTRKLGVLLAALPLMACGGQSLNTFTQPSGAGAGGAIGNPGHAGVGQGAGAPSSSGAGGGPQGSSGAGSDDGGAGMGGAPSSGAGGSSSGSGGAPMGGAHAGGATGTGVAGAGAAGAGGDADPKRITVVGVFGGVNAVGSHAPPPINALYTWPDPRVKMWTNFDSGVSLGPSAVTVEPTYLTSGVELQIGSDAKTGMTHAGTVAIVKVCNSGQPIEKSNTLIADWAEPDNTQVPLGPIMSIYVSVMKQAGHELLAAHPKSDIRYVHVMLLGEADAQKVTLPAAAIATQLRTVTARLSGAFPESIIVASEPNAALTGWWPENAEVRTAFETVGAEGAFSLVNADAIPPYNASAHDPAYDVSQLLNLGSKLEYGIERQIEMKWGAP